MPTEQQQVTWPYKNCAVVGLWIGGGTAEKNQDGLKSMDFLNAMRQKGRFQPFLEGLTVRAVIDPEAGLFSAACRARELAESSGTLT